jgi:hypothetical protein
MTLKDYDLGKIYRCRLSKKEMLVIELDKPVGQESTGVNDEKGNPIMKDILEKFKAGKYTDEVNGNPVFKVDEISDGQLELIND